MRRIFPLLLALILCLSTAAQERKVQNKPYTDLRTLHFGIQIGMNLQDIELRNAGIQRMMTEEGETVQEIYCDADKWSPGFSVGVLADLRVNSHLSLRFTPALHFGGKHLTFRNVREADPQGNPVEVSQDMKNTYLSVPLDLKFSAERFNNYRPYLIAGINQMLNLTSKSQDYIQLKRTDTMVEVGLGCDFYLPFFKLIPELKFCYSLHDTLDKKHAEELTDTNKRIYTNAVTGGHSKMIVLTLYFE